MEELQRILPIGVQDFKSLRKDGFLYIDKTQFLYRLVHKGKVYFLSRPRRFGKSLFLSTLAAYFSGEKELFKGLYIEKAEEEFAARMGCEPWETTPVLYLDLNAKNFDSEQALLDTLERHLINWENDYGIERRFDAPEDRFYDIIEQIYNKTKKRVAIFVDEYDKPLLQTLEKEQQQLHESYRRTLAGFYSTIKSSDKYIRFAFLTGVTKFSKLSVFSGLNNLNDISLDDQYAGICGITEEELQSNFAPEISALGKKLALSDQDTLAVLKKKYDGYRFAIEGENVYNPFNLLKVFQKLSLGYYWFATGTPTFLAKKLQEIQYNLPELNDDVRLTRIDLENPHEFADDPIQILYQAGYLTIKEYNKEYEEFTLGFPNDEVRYSFWELLLKCCFTAPATVRLTEINRFVEAVKCGDVDAFMARMQSFIAGMGYSPTSEVELLEWNYQMVFYLVFRLMGLHVHTEVHNIQGRADCVVELPDTVYIFEFKLWSVGTPEEALAQIREKGYAVPYQASGKKIIAIGASFDETKRNIEAWKCETL